MLRLPVGDQAPVAGSYSSALATIAVFGETSGDEHLAVGQQRRGVTGARCLHAAGGGPDAGSRIIQFRAWQNSRGAAVPPATSTLPLASNVAV